LFLIQIKQAFYAKTPSLIILCSDYVIAVCLRDVNKATEYKAKARTFKAKATSIYPRPRP